MTEALKEKAGARESSLDIADEDLQALAKAFTDLANEYFDSVAERPVFTSASGESLRARFDEPPPAAAESLAKLIADCRDVVAGSRHNGHPRFFGYVASPSTPVGAFADLFTSALNASVTSWRSAPAGTQIEQTVARWLGALIGYDDDAHGLLTSGGSMANLTALLIAHRSRSSATVSAAGIQNHDARMTLYASDQVHFSILKAADILGLGHESVRLAPTDDRFSVDVAALRAAIERDREQGLKPFCVVGSAGTAATGAVDSLNELAQLAREFDLWFHVDGAYGGPAAMVPDRKPMFTGLALADSVSLDPHKWLYTPLDCGCLLFRDPARARKAFMTEADYVKVLEFANLESFAFWDYGIELSRRFRALKVWLTLKYYGAARIAAAIADDMAMANYMAEEVVKDPRLELLAPVQLSICCFRYVPERLRARLNAAATAEERDGLEREINRLNEQIMYRVQRGGQAYLSNAVLRGKFALRACIINFRTTRRDIDLTLATVRDVARQIETEHGD
ncbi:MAG TPA: aminotransferase class I/II-fold pyridoxal phosphate-dependent enzyme [Pyrinomonadaceae bacterium]|nr:aminotransferase class I/II-fold pyridoxal phosphate-dependent enzyme [Pyrinomonadaceae bacterium]